MVWLRGFPDPLRLFANRMRIHRLRAVEIAVTIILLFLGVNRALSQPGPPSSKNSIPTNRIALIKSLLKQQGYWITRVDSIKDYEYDFALSAFRKIHNLPHLKNFDDRQLEILKSARTPLPKTRSLVYSSDTERAHLEVNLKTQVLFVVDSQGNVTHILPVSSGNGKVFSTKRSDSTVWTRKAVTPRGQFRINRKIRGWRKSALGLLYFPMYYYGGAAVHGALVVPNTPASHGCIRIPMFASVPLFEMTSVGHPILVY